MGFINQLITGGHHPVGYTSISNRCVVVRCDENSAFWGFGPGEPNVYPRKRADDCGNLIDWPCRGRPMCSMAWQQAAPSLHVRRGELRICGERLTSCYFNGERICKSCPSERIEGLMPIFGHNTSMHFLSSYGFELFLHNVDNMQKKSCRTELRLIKSILLRCILRCFTILVLQECHYHHYITPLTCFQLFSKSKKLHQRHSAILCLISQRSFEMRQPRGWRAVWGGDVPEKMVIILCIFYKYNVYIYTYIYIYICICINIYIYMYIYICIYIDR